MFKKNNKRRLAAAMALLLCVITLSGCSDIDLGTSAGEISDYDSVQFIPVDDNPPESANESTVDISDVQTESREPVESHEPAESHEPEESYEPKDYSENVTAQGSGFVVSDKMYDFEGNNLVVLNVENKTNKNYTIYIHGQYLDENGKVIKEETKEFRGFEAGWKNNFFFTPGIPFAKFTYKMETKAYTGKCYGSIFSLTYKWERKEDEDDTFMTDYLKWEVNGKIGDAPNWKDYMVDSLMLSIFHEYQSAEVIDLKESFLILSRQGEVLHAPDVVRNKMFEGDYTGNDVDGQQLSYICSDNAKMVEEFENGEIVVLISIEVAKLFDSEKRFEW